MFSREVSEPPLLVGAPPGMVKLCRSAEPEVQFERLPFGLTQMADSVTCTSYTSTGRHVSLGVSRRRTGLVGYQSTTSPVSMLKRDSVVGHVMQPSWVNLADMNPSL